MAQMIRKQIYIDAENERYLKRRAKALGITEAEVVRTLLAEAEERDASDAALEALEDILTDIREHRMRDVPQTGGWKFNRDELYEERMDQIMRRPGAAMEQAGR